LISTKVASQTKNLIPAEKQRVESEILNSYGFGNEVSVDSLTSVIDRLEKEYSQASKFMPNQKEFKSLVFYHSKLIDDNDRKNLWREKREAESNLRELDAKIDLHTSAMAAVKANNNLATRVIETYTDTPDHIKIAELLTKLKSKVRFEDVKYRACLKKLLEVGYNNELDKFYSLEELEKRLKKRLRRRKLKLKRRLRRILK